MTVSRRTVILVLSAVAAAALAAAYYFVDPATAVLMPKCPFKLVTGFDCPACGTQRAMHALLHGHWRQALAVNPFMVVSWPYLAAVIVATFGRWRWVPRWRAWVLHPATVWAYVILFCGWWILRNLPFYG